MFDNKFNLATVDFREKVENFKQMVPIGILDYHFCRRH